MTDLVLGPLLRHVGPTDATIWVETDASCEVEVRAGEVTARGRTFSVGGHHYAIIVVQGLPIGSSTAYQIAIDGTDVWPVDGDRPPSVIRTLDPDGPVRVAFGSCREPGERGTHRGIDPDVLVGFADRLLEVSADRWPTILFLAGDQVYADETSPAMRAWIAQRRDPSRPPRYEVADFEEYTQLYREAWSEPSIRWLLSTVPISMIFDDHDIRDDWNTSQSWREDAAKTTWWPARITGGLMAYWLYQHLGNLSPAGLAANETLRDVRAASDGEEILRRFAEHADREADGAKGTLWSYRRDLGRVRLVVIDSRCGRILAEGQRAMVSDDEFRWIEGQLEDGDYDHLVIGTSLPWLLPRGLHEIESWDEVISRPGGLRIVAAFGEWLRRAADLEHWAAFRESFDRLADLLGRIGRGEHGRLPPATIAVLSGDVHHTYVAEAEWPDATTSRVVQVTCSPLHNTIPRPMKLVFWIGWSRVAEFLMKGLSRLSGVPSLPIHWHHPTGPHFGNTLSTLTFEGRNARLILERSRRPADREGDRTGEPTELETLAELDLTAPGGIQLKDHPAS